VFLRAPSWQVPRQDHGGSRTRDGRLCRPALSRSGRGRRTGQVGAAGLEPAKARAGHRVYSPGQLPLCHTPKAKDSVVRIRQPDGAERGSCRSRTCRPGIRPPMFQIGTPRRVGSELPMTITINAIHASYGTRTHSNTWTGCRADPHTHEAIRTSGQGDRPDSNWHHRGSQPRALPVELQSPSTLRASRGRNKRPRSRPGFGVVRLACADVRSPRHPVPVPAQ
jgi:hypothetical protein